MHYDVLVPVVEELSTLLAGARVERVLQGEDGGLYLLLRRERKSFTLLVSPERSLPRLHLVSRKPRSAPAPHPLVLNLRSRLPGSRVANIGMVNEDRIVVLRFEKYDAAYHLVFELTGPSANLFFTDAEFHILAMYHPAHVSQQARRLLTPGSTYVPPQKKTDRPALPAGIEFTGRQPSPNEAAENYYGRIAGQLQAAALRTELRSSLAKALKRAERRRAAVTSDLHAAEPADTYRQTGDLILANLRRLKLGMESVELERYDGVRLTVALDAKLSPTENAAAYFKKFKKAKAGLPVIVERLRRTEEEIAEIKSRIEEIGRTEDSDVSRCVRSAAYGVTPVEKERRDSGRKSSKETPGIRRIFYRGWEILLGTDAAANDALTGKLARPDDLWLHAEGLPGSHVLVRNPMKGEIPPDILLKAASLAATHSKGKMSEKVPVTYTFARFVKKPKGAKPGLAQLSRRRTVMVRPGNGDAAQ